ncbi:MULTISPECIES: class E sortase [Streptomyces]|uniref:Class E sortase n=1 Tax=Streptomyces dengpaensis TaxID=2049881 RepID=A0ABM6SSF6_9ACTN|nr:MULTISPECIES: class E sortase [Streptomyces]AVH57653.1 class E sortase [Streptomyces dengpaensis]PIB07842.1 class E sortase [Streptomyces sp. HG99]
MTALRPERDSSPSYGGEAAYGGADAFEGAYGIGGGYGTGGAGVYDAAERLADPLTDPLPGQRQGQPQGGQQEEWYDPEGYARDWYAGQVAAQPQPQPPQPPRQAQVRQQSPSAYEEMYARPPYEATYAPPSYEEPVAAPYQEPVAAPYEEPVATPLTVDDETVGLRVSETPRRAESAAGSGSVPATGGRAARRKAARRHGRRGGAQEAQEPQGDRESAEKGAGAPLSRVEARRAARARKPSAGVIASRVIGEVFITTGVLMLLFVTYQLWWSNVRANQQAGSAANSLQEDWAKGKRNPGTFEPGQGFAILHIPKLDVVSPIAEGIDKQKVLDRGMVGHYAEGATKTSMPDAKTGNFGIAGHRNTHGEPFRYINRLQPGDEIVVETQDDYYVYEMAAILPVTNPGNTSVLDPIPKGSTFTKPGRYITLTTCTPEFTSKYRMIVWGKMVEDRPRSKGKPDALVE